MADKTRTCPECNGQMTLRLGEYQCQACSHTMLPGKDDDDQPTFGARSGSNAAAYGYGDAPHKAGERKATLGRGEYDPGAQYRNNPSASSSRSVLGGMAPDDMYLPKTDQGIRSMRDVTDDPLRTEKLAFIGVDLVTIILAFALLYNAVPEFQVMGTAAIMIGLVIALPINAAIYWIVFFSDQAWLKWTCFGCSGCGLAGTLMTLLFGSSMMAYQMSTNMMASDYQDPWVNMLGAGKAIWLLTILYRDVQRVA